MLEKEILDKVKEINKIYLSVGLIKAPDSNEFIEVYDWQYDDAEQVWCGYCTCGYQIWRAKGLPVEICEIKECVVCLDCGKIGCHSCFILNDNHEWLCKDCDALRCTYDYVI